MHKSNENVKLEIKSNRSLHRSMNDLDKISVDYNTDLLIKAKKFGECDIWGEYLINEDKYLMNPRCVIRFLRGGKYYYYHIESAYEYFIKHNNRIDPYNKQEIDQVDIERIIAYTNFYMKYKHVKINTSVINNTLHELFRSDNSRPKLNEIIEFARGFILPEDIVKYISVNINFGMDIDREFANNYLINKKCDTFIFRGSSIKSTEFSKVFIISQIKSGKIMHIPFVHIYGKGIFEMDAKKVHRNSELPLNSDEVPILYNKVYISIVDLLTDTEHYLLKRIHREGKNSAFYRDQYFD
jgi:hypothetical protein